MNFFHSITVRFTLWYLAILGILLVLLGGGVYVTLSRVLHNNLDESLKARAEQLSEFRNIMSIVAGGTFEEEIGEHISFYYYADGKLMHISHKDTLIPIRPEQIDRAIAGSTFFWSAEMPSGGRLRIFVIPFTPENRDVRQEAASEAGGFRDRRDTDRDGTVSLAELISHEKQMFARTDTDSSGTISRHEMDEGDGRRSAGPDDRFEKKDKNRDGAVSLAEYLADEEEKFRRRGIDRDGRLSPGEMKRNRRPGDPHRMRGPERRSGPQPLETGPAALVVARPTQDIEESLKQLFRILLAAIPLTLFCSGGDGVFLARRALRPVGIMTDTAREISERDLSRRIEVTTKDELGRLALTLNQMIGRLEGAFQRQKQFTGDASHELRAPLAVIQAEASLALGKERPAEAYRKSLEIIAQESDRMAGVISQLLTLARADAGKDRLRFERINLTEFVQEFCYDAKILCREKGIRLRVKLAISVFVNGDPGSLRRLMHNLLSNAIRYTAKAGTISVRLRRKSAWAVLTVSDTGIGIPAKGIPYLFERFYRVDKARSRSEGGSGLGLAICKYIADAHKGRILVESQVGRGSSFHVKLPLSR